MNIVDDKTQNLQFSYSEAILHVSPDMFKKNRLTIRHFGSTILEINRTHLNK